MKAISTQFTPVSKAYDTDVTSKNIPNVSDNQVVNSLDFDSLKENLQALEQDEFVFKTEFPYDVFPEKLQRIIKATHKALNYPIDFFGSSILYAFSVACGNNYEAEIKAGWREKGILWIALVGRAGTMKSHPLRFALKPFFEVDKHHSKMYEEQLSLYKENEQRPPQERETLPLPVLRKSLITDFTPEVLAYIHRANPKSLGVYVDELGTWFKNFNRYNEGAVTESWLSLWSATTVTIDRKSDSIRLDSPYISVCGGIQPSILNALTKKGNGENGFIDRILFAHPENLKKPKWNDVDLPYNVELDYKDILSKFIDEMYVEGENATCLRFTKESKAKLKKWQHQKTDIANDSSDKISGMYSKMDIYAIRFALIFELMFYACGESNLEHISERAVNASIAVTEYFIMCAKRVYKKVFNVLETLPANKRKIYKALGENFTTQDAISKGEKHGLKRSAIEKFLRNKDLFTRIGKGRYSKNT